MRFSQALLFLFVIVSITFAACIPSAPTLAASPTTVMVKPTANAPSPTSTNWWHPMPGLTWQWHLSDPPVDTSVDAQVYDIDLFDNDASIIDDLHARGRKVICYISAGSREEWRPDASQFPPEVVGKDYEGWPGEKWLDIRQIDKLAPIMRARLDLCAAKGFDAVEPDNMEVSTNDSGFPITAQDEIRYALWLANEAHTRGLAIGMKNAPHLVRDLLPHFDFAITEDCFAYDWYGQMEAFIQAGKPVFAAEYTDMDIDFNHACRMARELNFSLILKDRMLTAFRTVCP